VKEVRGAGLGHELRDWVVMGERTGGRGGITKRGEGGRGYSGHEWAKTVKSGHVAELMLISVVWTRETSPHLVM
jgi:hypothetical protein